MPPACDVACLTRGVEAHNTEPVQRGNDDPKTVRHKTQLQPQVSNYTKQQSTLKNNAEGTEVSIQQTP
jgi:hypothetical protein